MNITLIDNYDSFSHNLAHALGAAATVTVHRNDAASRESIQSTSPDAIVLSPGPGHPGKPADFGVCAELIAQPLDVPMLGVCLGMQGMAHHTGATVVAAPSIVHGEADRFAPVDHPIFAGLSGNIQVGRYHSLCVDASTLSSAWQPLGTATDGTLMAMAHRERPWIGLQFHPESILTPAGPTIINNFLEMCA